LPSSLDKVRAATVGAFDRPTPGFGSGLALEVLSLLAADTDVRREPELFEQLSHLGPVIIFVDAGSAFCYIPDVTGPARVSAGR
jgi:hypothetical protein